MAALDNRDGLSGSDASAAFDVFGLFFVSLAALALAEAPELQLPEESGPTLREVVLILSLCGDPPSRRNKA